MNPKLSQYFLGQEEPYKSCLLALRDTVLAAHDQVHETVKYGMPCYTVNNKPLCYLWKDKKTQWPYILLVNGKSLDHPNLEQGSRVKMKTFSVDPKADLPLSDINDVLTMALKIH